VALALGIVVLLVHVFTTRPLAPWFDWLHIDWPDVAKHFSLLGAFALAYRLSWPSMPPRRAGSGSVLGPGLSTALLCGGWGALCEILQHWIPARDFAPAELLVNALTPALVGILGEATRRWMLSVRG
jgi:hypothetical protein